MRIKNRDSTENLNKKIMKEARKKTKRLLSVTDRKKPVILIMCYSFYGGGAERVSCRLACELSKDYQIIMLCAEDKGMTYTLPVDVPVIVLPLFYGDEKMINDNRAIYTAWLKRKYKIHAAISFMYLMNKINTAAKHKDRVICSERNSPLRREPEHFDEIKGFYEKADYVVFQSEAVRSLFGEKVKQHSGVILNPVEVKEIKDAREEHHRIINIGRLNAQKNQAMLIRAFARFHRTHQDYTLSIYGDGPLLEDLEGLVKSLNLQDAVIFHGNVRDIHSQITDAEFFVLSSDYEGLSNALLECMMMGMACISTGCEGSVDIIRSGENGILTDIGDEEQMYEAMKLLAENPDLRKKLGEQARADSDRFRAENIVQQWKRIIE